MARHQQLHFKTTNKKHFDNEVLHSISVPVVEWKDSNYVSGESYFCLSLRHL